MGTVPVGVPQRRTLTIVNPLSVPITMECFIDDDGTERPLVLDILNVNDHLPIDVVDPVRSTLYQLRDPSKCDRSHNEIEHEELDDSSQFSVKSCQEEEDSLSSNYETFAMGKSFKMI